MRKIPGPDVAFLYGERPEWHFHVSAVIVVESSSSDRFSLEEVRRTLVHRVHKVPQFRWKIHGGPFADIDGPYWVDDPDFDLDRHLHHIALPAPGGDQALGRLIGQLVSSQLDRSRPLWEMWLIDGLERGRSALLAKIHHSIIDGESAAELATLLFDLEAEPEPDAPPPPWRPEPPPTDLTLALSAASRAATWPFRLAKLGQQYVQQGVTWGRHALGAERQTQPFQAPRTSLNGTLTPSRSFAAAAVPLDEAKTVKDAFDVKLNDVVLAIAAGALRSYLADQGDVPTEPLVAQVPVSMRAETPGHIGTSVGAMFAAIATDLDDPAERLRAIRRTTRKAKEVRDALSAQKTINLSDTAAPGLFGLGARMWTSAGLDTRAAPVFNLIVSSIPGPSFDLYLAGARIEAMYPMGPLLYGSGVNLTVVSNASRLDFGVLACPDLVPDPWDIAGRIPPALDELTAAATSANRTSS